MIESVSGDFVKYRYTLVYWIKGLNLFLQNSQLPVLNDSSVSLTATMSNFIDTEIDKRTALANLVLKGLLGISQTDEDVDTKLLSEVTLIREERSKKYSQSACFLIISTEGDIDPHLSEPTREFDKFSFGFSDLDKEQIHLSISNQVTAVITSLALSLPNFLGVEKITDTIILYQEDDKPFYPLIIKFGRMSAYTSTEPTAEQIASAKKLYLKLVSEQNTAKSSRLLVSSLQTADDTLRAFIFAWTSLEIFVNKNFNTYETKLWNGLDTSVQGDFLKRIQEVMKDKYRLADKFTIISSQLCPDDADNDIQLFKKIKKQRDNLSHGEDINEEDLLLVDVQNLTRKYLLHHIRVGNS